MRCQRKSGRREHKGEELSAEKLCTAIEAMRGIGLSRAEIAELSGRPVRSLYAAEERVHRAGRGG